MLYEDLSGYLNQNIYPMHMPGNKRRLSPYPGCPVHLDFTEVPGTDDLHHAKGILRDSMERAAQLFGADRTFYIVNGSTCGNLVSVFSTVPENGEMIVARNCHRSVFHALELRNITAHWLWPETISGSDFHSADASTSRSEEMAGHSGDSCKDKSVSVGNLRTTSDEKLFPTVKAGNNVSSLILGSISPEGVCKTLEKYPNSSAVLITSPTYEGIISDIRSISEICHTHGVPLIVDEAHGAHLGLFRPDVFPDSALHLGADLVVQSPHKTLFSLTQTSFLHIGYGCCTDNSRSLRAEESNFKNIHNKSAYSDRIETLEGGKLPVCHNKLIDVHAVEHWIDVFETSSPSYPLVLSLAGCADMLSKNGQEIFDRWAETIHRFDKTMEKLEHLRVLGHGKETTINHSFFAYDPSKIPILTDGTGLTGSDLAEILRQKYHFELEMTCGTLALAMTGPGDDPLMVGKFGEALLCIDRSLNDINTSCVIDNDEDQKHRDYSETTCVMTIHDAMQKHEKLTVEMSEACGKISAEYVFCYPPGIPLLIPGEMITEGMIRRIQELQEAGTEIRFSGSPDRSDCVQIIKSICENGLS